MSTQFRSDLKSAVPTGVSRCAGTPFGTKDLTALAEMLSPVIDSFLAFAEPRAEEWSGLWAHDGSICYVQDIVSSRPLTQTKHSSEPAWRHRSLTSSRISTSPNPT